MQLGPERAAAAWPLHAMIASGALTTITSDAPIATPDWRIGLDASLVLLGRDDAETRAALLRRITVDPARRTGHPPGRASMSARSPTSRCWTRIRPNPDAFAGIGIARTIVDGRTVFARADPRLRAGPCVECTVSCRTHGFVMRTSRALGSFPCTRRPSSLSRLGAPRRPRR
jgi:hypothetical protein